MTNQPSIPESSLEQLNLRIARLAIALGLSLHDETDVERVLAWREPPAVSQDRRGSGQNGSAWRSGRGPDQRVAHLWGELRGLMVLRYDMQLTYVEQVGVEVTRQMMVESEESLKRKGFKHGEDGVDIDRLFNGI